MEISYQREAHPDLGVAEFADLLVRSTLAERRPMGDPEALEGMLRHADVIVTARAGGLLVGISRALTDYSFCTYLSDLAVDQAYQRMGVGKRLVAVTHQEAGLHTTLVLLAAPRARAYYPRIGMVGHDSCWIIERSPRNPG